MSENEDGGGANEPEDGAEGGGEPEEGDANHEEAGVERLLGDRVLADLNRVGSCGDGRSSRLSGVVEVGPVEIGYEGWMMIAAESG